ncbi:hypothetical protein PHYPSEUDO_006814 [Phytophthora pseudosyringae]|uniref:Uncharacterized protein n=1 Tax=Phytophthora pseudosyringae TaxID=221518 RepID=A0A8T1VKR2_9STRA|nr:hypothetical protein PHYPSEUDO_006814 [Phytophthora pseudosyringae]
MVIAAQSAKKSTPSARGATVPASILLSPISVAHRSQMLEAEAGAPSTGNAIRDQWVANLQKKRMAAAAGIGAPIGNGNPMPPSAPGTSTATMQSNSRSNSNSRGSSAKKNSRSRSAAARTAAKNRSSAQLSAAALEKSLNAHQRNAHRHSQFATMSSGLIVDSQIAMSDADALALGQSSMLFSGLSCFELESPSFSRLISSSLDGDFPLASPMPTATTTKKTKSRPKRMAKAGSKKRPTHCLALDVDQPKPRTPRRKLNCGSATFDDFDLDYSVSSGTSGFPGVGTPSNFRVDASCTSTRHMWGQDLDLAGAGGYADTFLDLPTPRLAEIPLMPTSEQSNASTTTSNSSRQSNDDQDATDKLDHPRLIRTNSIEQEGLSHFLEQTNLDGSDGGHGDELYQLAATPLVSARKSPFSGGSFFTSSATPRSAAAAAAAVDECFGGKLSTFTSTWPMPSPLGSSSRPSASAARRRMAPRDQKHPPEFETLMDEYKFTDIDHELDSFYLDTMEAIGNDLDLMSN